MRETKLKVCSSTSLAVAVRMAALPAAIAALLLVAATAASAEPAKIPPDAEVIDPVIAGAEADGIDVVDPDGTSEIGDDGSEFAPEWARCLKDPDGNESCFEDVGDRFYVYDGRADGASAAAYWWTTGEYYRTGTCYNSIGAGTWDVCNYNLDEDGTVCWHTCHQNRSAGGPLLCYLDVYTCKQIDGG